MRDNKILSKNPLCFVPKTIENIDRIDCFWSNPEILDLLKKLDNITSKPNYTTEPLEKIAEVKGGKRLPKGTLYPETDFAPIPYVRVTDIMNNKIDLSNCAYISEAVHKTIRQYQLKKGNIVISIVGTIGETGIFEKKIEKCNFSENMAKIVVKNEKRINPYYLCYFLNSPISKKQIERLTVGALQYKLSLSSVRSIKIVYPESLSIQEQAVAEVRKYENKAQKTLQEYKKIVKKIKNVVSKRLNIDLRELSKEKTFRLRPEEIKDPGSRIDVPFNSPYLKRLRNKIQSYSYDKLSNLINIQKKGTISFTDYYNLVELDDIDEEIGKVRNIKATPELGSDKILFREDEILISKLQPEKGKIIIVNEELDGCVGSSELIPAILKSNRVTNQFLWTILRSRYILDQWEHQITGSSRMRIGREELRNTLVPIPKPEIQKKIVKETQEKLEMAKQLKREYEENIRTGKQVFLKCLTKNGKKWQELIL